MATIVFKWFSVPTKSPTTFMKELNKLIDKYESEKGSAGYRYDLEE